MGMRSKLAPTIRLRQVLPDVEILGDGDIELDRCASDWRLVEPGDLYVAIDRGNGDGGDGHDWAAEAVARGARAVLAHRPVGTLPVPIARVADTRDAHARICQHLAGKPAKRLKLIGVAGTRGKTVTSCLITSILQAAGNDVGMIGTLGYFDGQGHLESQWTTPPPDVLSRWLGRMVDHDCTHAVLEVSRHGLEESRLAGLEFDAGCVTNMRREERPDRGSTASTRHLPTRLLDHVRGEGVAVFNVDDTASAAYVPTVDVPVLSIGVRREAEITGTPVEHFPSEQTFLLTAGCDTIPVRVPMIGTHHIHNCLIAAAIGLSQGIDLPTIVRGLEAVDRVPGRLERIEQGQPFSVYIDVAGEPTTLAHSLRTIAEVVPGRLICVFGAEGERDRSLRAELARIVARHADIPIITTDNPRNEPTHRIERDLLEGVDNPTDVHLIPDRTEAIGWALAEAEPGDGVLVAGKGHRKLQIVGDTPHPFDDVEVVRAWLDEHREQDVTLGWPA